MSAGFEVADEVFWGTNGSVEAYVEAMAAIACEHFGPDDQLTKLFRGVRDGFYPGYVVFLDQWLETPDSRKRFLRVLDEATSQLLSEDVFSESGKEWVGTVVAEFRAKVVSLDT